MHKRKAIRLFVMLQVSVLVLMMGAAPALANDERNVEALTQAKTGIQLVEPEAKAKTGEPYELWYITDRTVKSPKSSNAKVAGTSVQNWGEVSYLIVLPLKTGQTKLSFTYNGKKYTTTYTVKNWANPVKKLTIGKASIASKFKKDARYKYNTAKRTFKNKKVNVVAASGWKIKTIEANLGGTGLKKLKNGSKIPKKTVSIGVILKHTKTGAVATVNVE